MNKERLSIWVGLCHLVTQLKGQAALAALPRPQDAHPIHAARAEEGKKDCLFMIVMRL
jgi:hypothetical protein